MLSSNFYSTTDTAHWTRQWMTGKLSDNLTTKSKHW